ncbi:EamA family transporter [Yinghuangia seranimata]|uniref:EamA family transporter n=1 Tax=Yinghuangia seranimata TaxID=408067 RepID=UPI00248C50BF|nr:EamA family transporter [Yinghuangia seranimata]MDI2124517.1 EamA family transporter [Yinghuangia seranimata]
MTIVLALLTSALWGFADFGAGLLSRRMASARVVVLSQAAAALVLAVVVAATGAYDEAGPRLWFAVGAGIVGPVALLCFYEALARGPMGVVSPLASAGVIIPVTVGLAVHGDRPGLLQYAGILVAVVGIALAGGPRLGGAAVHRSTLLLTLGAALGFGTVFALIAEASTNVTGLFLALFVQRVVNVGSGGALLLLTERRGRARAAAGPPHGTAEEPPSNTPTANGASTRPAWARMPAKLVLALTVVGVADVAANGTYSTAARLGPVTVAAVLASLYPVVTALAAHGILKERLQAAQALGAGLALAGTVLLAAG